MNLQLGWSTNIYYKDIKMQSAPGVLQRWMIPSPPHLHKLKFYSYQLISVYN
jgi:hypothetical protein